MLMKFTGYMLAVIAVFLWSFNIIYSKMLTPYLTPVQISFIRWMLALMFLLPFALKKIRTYAELLKRNLVYVILMGLTGLGIVNFCVYHAGHTADAIDMALIDTLSPVIIIILSHFFSRETITFRTVAGILSALTGVVILILHGDFSHFNSFKFVPGDFWMLAAATLFAIYSLVQKKVSRQLPSPVVLCCAASVAAIIFLPVFIKEWRTQTMFHLPQEVYAILLILGFLNSGMAYLFWGFSIKSIGLVHTGAIYYLMPVFSSVSAYFILGERFYASQIYGAVMVCCGILLVIVHKSTDGKHG